MNGLCVPYLNEEFDDRFHLYTIAADKYPIVKKWNLRHASTNIGKIKGIIGDKFGGLQDYFEKQYKTHEYPMEFSLRTLNKFSKDDKEQKKHIYIKKLTNRTTSVFLGIFLKAAEQIWHYKFKDDWKIICVTGDLDYDGEKLKLVPVEDEDIRKKYKDEFLELAENDKNKSKKYLFLYISDKIEEADLVKEGWLDNVTIKRYSSDKAISDIIKYVFEPVTSKYDFSSFEPEQRKLINYMEGKNERNFGYLRGTDFDKNIEQNMLYEFGWRGFFIYGGKGCGKSATAMDIASYLTLISKIYAPIWINFDNPEIKDFFKEGTYNSSEIEAYFISSIAALIIPDDKNKENELSLSEKKELIIKEFSKNKYLVVVDNLILQKDGVDCVLRMIEKLFSELFTDFLYKPYLLITSRKLGSEPYIDKLDLTTREVPRLSEDQVGELIKNIARKKQWENKISEAERNNKFNDFKKVLFEKCDDNPGLIIYVISHLQDTGIDNLSDDKIIDNLKSEYMENQTSASSQKNIPVKGKIKHKVLIGSVICIIAAGLVIAGLIKFLPSKFNQELGKIVEIEQSENLDESLSKINEILSYALELVSSIENNETEQPNNQYNVTTTITNDVRRINPLPSNIQRQSESGTNLNRAVETAVSLEIEINEPERETPVELFVSEIIEGRYRIITHYIGEEVNVKIPASIDGLPVESIGENAFKDNKSLKSVSIPATVETIGNNAFYGCSNLEIVTFHTLSSITTIGNTIFSSCYKLKSINIPSSVTTIRNDVFRTCSNLENIIVDEGNKEYSSINGILFDRDVKVLIYYPPENANAEYSIPDTVTAIMDYAFYNHKNLQIVDIPSSVTAIGKNAFLSYYNSDNKLKKITVNDKNRRYRDINGVLFDKDIKVLICYPSGNANWEYSIPDTVTTIMDNAFYGCSSLESIKIPPDVEIIEDEAFSSCSKLRSINIPPKVRTIRRWTFSGCRSLENVNFDNPSKLISIMRYAFSGCRSLESIIIPPSVTDIEESAFNNCDKLTNVTISSRTRVAKNVFHERVNKIEYN